MKSRRFIIELTNERIISPSGLAIVGGMLGKSELVKQLNRIPVDERKRSEPQNQSQHVHRPQYQAEYAALRVDTPGH